MSYKFSQRLCQEREKAKICFVLFCFVGGVVLFGAGGGVRGAAVVGREREYQEVKMLQTLYE